MLVPDWWRVLTRAWSVYILTLIAVLQLLPDVLLILAPTFEITDGQVNMATAVAAVAGIALRLIHQGSLAPAVPPEV